MPRRSSGSSGSSSADLDLIIKTICEKTGVTVTAEWAARVRDQILGARDIRNPGAYLRRVIAGAPPDTYIPHSGPAAVAPDPATAARAAQIRARAGQLARQKAITP